MNRYFPAYAVHKKLGFEKATDRVLKRRRDDDRFDVVFLNFDEQTCDLWTSDGPDIWADLCMVAEKQPLSSDSNFEQLQALFPALHSLPKRQPGGALVAALALLLLVTGGVLLPAELKALSLVPFLYLYC